MSEPEQQAQQLTPELVGDARKRIVEILACATSEWGVTEDDRQVIDSLLAAAARVAGCPDEGQRFDDMVIAMEDAAHKLCDASEDHSSHFYETILRAALGAVAASPDEGTPNSSKSVQTLGAGPADEGLRAAVIDAADLFERIHSFGMHDLGLWQCLGEIPKMIEKLGGAAAGCLPEDEGLWITSDEGEACLEALRALPDGGCCEECDRCEARKAVRAKLEPPPVGDKDPT